MISTEIKEDHDSIEGLYNYLIDNNFIHIHPDESYIDISKFLRDDLSINLELLELALNKLYDSKTIKIIVIGIDQYFSIRNVTDERNVNIEKTFILRFCQQVINEFYGEEVARISLLED